MAKGLEDLIAQYHSHQLQCCCIQLEKASRGACWEKHIYALGRSTCMHVCKGACPFCKRVMEVTHNAWCHGRPHHAGCRSELQHTQCAVCSMVSAEPASSELCFKSGQPCDESPGPEGSIWTVTSSSASSPDDPCSATVSCNQAHLAEAVSASHPWLPIAGTLVSRAFHVSVAWQQHTGPVTNSMHPAMAA